jgi:two-component system cell cycle response regulator CpdR
LVVEDEQGIRAVLRRALEQAGYEVVTVNDGAAGFDAVVTAGVPYDLVITNNCMPSMDGAELVTRLRQHNPSLPILHLDDHSLGHRPELPSDIPNLYKPFGLDVLLETVEGLLKKGAGRS